MLPRRALTWAVRRFLSSSSSTTGTSSSSCPPLTVLYDGACPLCRREIGVYKGLKQRQPVQFTDISDSSTMLPPGTTRAELLARFHVREPSGKIVSGADAFLLLWERMPGWRWISILGRVPGIAWVMEKAYMFFLRYRPAIQRLVHRLEGDQK